MYDGAACGVARIPAGKPVEGKEKATGESLLSTVALICLRGVHLLFRSCINRRTLFVFAKYNVRRVGSRGGTPLVGGVGAKNPHDAPLATAFYSSPS